MGLLAVHWSWHTAVPLRPCQVRPTRVQGLCMALLLLDTSAIGVAAKHVSTGRPPGSQRVTCAAVPSMSLSASWQWACMPALQPSQPTSFSISHQRPILLAWEPWQQLTASLRAGAAQKLLARGRRRETIRPLSCAGAHNDCI